VCFFVLSTSLAWADEVESLDEVEIYIEDGVLYSNVQTFQQESYILKVIGSGSPMTVVWQFDVDQVRDYWLDKQVVSVRLGRQVIPDLVTQRWLMRDLSAGVVRHTTDAREAMQFLSSISQVAVLDVSVLNLENEYVLNTRFFLYEGEVEDDSWLPLFNNSGEDIGSVLLSLGLEADHE